MYQHTIVSLTENIGYWEAASKYSDTTLIDAGAAQIGVSFCTIAWARTTAAGTREDLATCTVAIAKDPGDNKYSLIIDADKATAEGHLDTWWTSYKTNVANQWSLVEYRWHDYHMGDPTLGPADRVTARSVAGTGGAAVRIPDQDAFTLTFQTASRRHWGRIYLPGTCFSRLDNTLGRWSTTQVDGATLNWHTFLSNLAGSSLELVVASKAHGGILELSQLSADDIPDIQRRRRPKQAFYHKTYSS